MDVKISKALDRRAESLRRRSGMGWHARPALALILIGGLLLGNLSATAAPADDERRIAAALPLPRDSVTLAEAFRGVGPIPRVARTQPLDVRLGQTERFWVSDPVTGRHRQITARLRYIGRSVLMYVDDAIDQDQALIEQSARVFEERIYPRNRAIFGPEPAPGIDGDRRLTVLNTLIRGAGGYFSPSDAVVRVVNRFSNERDMFVIDIGSYPLGSDGYAATLAHEFQHMIHEGRRPGAATWFDEGMATIAEDLNGYTDSFTPQLYLNAPDLPLTDWEPIGQHYGMSRLFLRYLLDQYGGPSVLPDLIAQNAGDDLGVLAKLASRRRSDITGFADLFADWAVANLINDPQVADGRYTYRLLPRTVAPEPFQTEGEVAQFGVDYLALPAGPLIFDFAGDATVGLTGVMPGEGRFAWWSNRGDQRVTTLTRALDLRRVRRATLRFRTWYELERGYDYGFVSVSIDGGKSWRALAASTTTTDDPQGFNFGNGFTGVSGTAGDLGDAQGHWVDQRVDLTPYAGRNVLLRFWAITDPAVNGSGLLLDDLSIPEIGLRDGFENGDSGWSAQGFVRVEGTLPQRWELRLVRLGAQTSVEPVAVGVDGRARIRLGPGERGVLVVIAATRYTSERARYRITDGT